MARAIILYAIGQPENTVIGVFSDPQKAINNADKYFFETENEIIRLPIPFEMGAIFASLPTAMLDSAYQDRPQDLTALIDLVKKN